MSWLNDPEIAAWFEGFLSLCGIAAIVVVSAVVLKDHFFGKRRGGR